MIDQKLCLLPHLASLKLICGILPSLWKLEMDVGRKDYEIRNFIDMMVRSV